MAGIPVFVFGSNLAGRHGKGAAKFALQQRGAIYGQGIGMQGNSFAIPTKDTKLKPLSLEAINGYVDIFLLYALYNPEKQFQITPIGCGLAGYKPEQIAWFFVNAPENCTLPVEFQEVFDAEAKRWLAEK